MKPRAYCDCGILLHDGACYEVNALSPSDARVWEKLFAMSEEERRDIVDNPKLYVTG